MTNKTIRLEKIEGSQKLFIEFQVLARNSIMRVWNHYKNNIPVVLKDRENFQSPEDMSEYLKNQKSDWEKKGFKVKGMEQPSAASASELE